MGPPTLKPDRPVQEQASAEQIVGNRARLERSSEDAGNQEQGSRMGNRSVDTLAILNDSEEGRCRILQRAFWQSYFHIYLSGRQKSVPIQLQSSTVNGLFVTFLENLSSVNRVMVNDV